MGLSVAVGRLAVIDALGAAGAAGGRPLGLYIHWPFCRSKCPYCDFNSHVRAGIDQPRWRDALLAEMAYWAERTRGRPLASIFFGGGTPSLMPPDTVAALIAQARALWPSLEAEPEITLEANPTSVEADKLAGFRAAGVNRVSLGVQALADESLRFLGREHSAGEALAAVALARALFPRLSFDLIYARPGQSVAAWREELGRALEHAADHLSVYQLTIEPGTAFQNAVWRGDFALPPEDTQAALFEATQTVLADAGLPAYEISNHAAPGQACRHNLIYWRYEDYIGIGPGAHGRLALPQGRVATRAHRAPEIWLDRVAAKGQGGHPPVPIDPDEARIERLMMGLRLVEGVDRRRPDLPDPCDALDPTAIARLGEAGFLEVTPDRLRATAQGRQRLDAVLAALLG